MKVLLANKYFFIKGGAEASYFQTARLLEAHGHEVVHFSMQHPDNFPSAYDRYFVDNVDYDAAGWRNALRVSHKLLYSTEARRRIERLIGDTRPDIVHLNNIYHQISPSILHAIKAHHLPVVMTLRDYKLVCASYLRLANGSLCRACRRGRYYHCLLKKCVKNSYPKSLLAIMEMYLHHNVLRLYDRVDVFVSPSRSLRAGLREMGFRRPITVLPNFVDGVQYVPNYAPGERTAAYFGRLSREKGLPTLLAAFAGLADVRLKIIGTGPLEPELREMVRRRGLSNVSFTGYKKGEALKREIQSSMLTVLPSECYENNPRAILESFALGKPVIASRIGGIPELINDGVNGMTFEPGNAADLKQKLRRAFDDTPGITQMGRNARRTLEKHYSPEVHYAKLMEIYESVLG